MLHSLPLSLIRRASSLAPASAVPSKDGSSSHRREAAPRTFPMHMYASDEFDRLEREGLTRDIDPLIDFVACATFFVTMTGTLGTLVLALAYAMDWL